MIYQNSRYYNQLIDYISFYPTGDNYPIVFYSMDAPGLSTWSEHIYSAGERLDSIAYQYYSRPDLWWIIPEYNPQVYDFDNITPGTVLKIPHV